MSALVGPVQGADRLFELTRGRNSGRSSQKSSQAENHVMRLLTCGGSVEQDNKRVFLSLGQNIHSSACVPSLRLQFFLTYEQLKKIDV